jgi:hypothetical protein
VLYVGSSHTRGYIPSYPYLSLAISVCLCTEPAILVRMLVADNGSRLSVEACERLLR